jgi:hypothetical protein
LEKKKMLATNHLPRAKTKSAQMLPKILPAAVCAQFIRCGKVGCRCASGHLHGPYHYCFWRESEKLKKAYVRKADVGRVRKLCQINRYTRQQRRAAFDRWRRLQFDLKEIEKWLP